MSGLKLSCAACGTPFEAQRSTRRFCSQACQKRARRSGAEVPVAPPEQPATVRVLPGRGGEPEGLVASIEKQLREAKRLDTWQGQSAVELARRIEAAQMDTGSAYAALHRELRAAMTLAMLGVGQKASALDKHRDELAARRAGRGA